MIIRDITDKDRKDFNSITTHPLQSFEWGEFREKTGIKVLRKGNFNKDRLTSAFQITIHKIPHTPFNAGYLPKGTLPDKDLISELKKIGREQNCIFIQLEPNIKIEGPKMKDEKLNSQFKPSHRPLFTRFTFQVDLTKSEEELLKNMHPKTRYNIRIAQKHQVKVEEDNSDQAFEAYLKLTSETTSRQKFYAHSEKYHRLMWETLKVERLKMKDEKLNVNKLTAHLLLAKFKPKNFSPLNPQPSTTTLVAWVLFVFKDTLYYPYGASSSEHREVMASNLMMWEAIKWGKKMGFKNFDMWGALGPNPDKNDPWYGFHRFKEGYGGELVEFVGSYDLVINPLLYKTYQTVDKIRWTILHFKKKF